MKDAISKIGIWAFIIAVIAAAVFSVYVPVPVWGMVALVVLGVIVGLVNVTEKEALMFLVSIMAFLISFTVLGNLVSKLFLGWAAPGAFLELVGLILAPAAIIVAIKGLYQMARN